MNQEASHLVTTRALPGVVQAEGFYRKKGRPGEVISKRKERIIWGQDNLFLEGRDPEGFIMQTASSSSGMGGGGGLGKRPTC